MAKAGENSITTRRRFLAGTAAAAVVAGGAAPSTAAPDDDAELLGLCAEFQAAHADLIAADGHTADDEFEVLHNRWWKLVYTITDLEATTWESVAAKAPVVQAALRLKGGSGLIGETFEDTAVPHDLLAMSFANDVARLMEQRWPKPGLPDKGKPPQPWEA